MKIGLGHLRMRPADFWQMTLPEFFAATEGYLEAKGAKRGSGGVKPPTRAEFDEMLAEMDIGGGDG